MFAMWPPGRASADGELERLGRADRFDRDVGAQAGGELAHDRARVLPLRVHDDIGTEALGGVEPAVREVDGDDVARAVETRRP